MKESRKQKEETKLSSVLKPEAEPEESAAGGGFFLDFGGGDTLP